MDMKFTVLLLVVLAAAAQAYSDADAETTLVKNTQKNGGLQADVNQYIDNTIHMLVPFIQTHGLEPMDLPDVEEGFEVRPLLITYSAKLKIHDGYMTGLSHISRSNDQVVQYVDKKLIVRLRLQFRDLLFIYKYLVKVMNIGPTGGIRATLDRFVVNFDLMLDFNNDELDVSRFALTDVGRLRVRLTGNILTDWLVNPVLGVFVRIFKYSIIRSVEHNIRDAINDAVYTINQNIKETIHRLESYTYNHVTEHSSKLL